MAAVALNPVLLRPHAEVAERVLLTGDPGRALRLAQWLTDAPRMLNHHRGLWGYTGEAADGRLLTIQGAGLGGPGAAAVVAELAVLGARRVVRLGTARAVGGAVAPGELVAVDPAIGEDGTSRALGAPERAAPEPALADAMVAAGARRGPVACMDLLHDGADPAAADAVAVDLASAAVFAAAGRHGVMAAAAVAITGRIGSPAALGAEGLEAAERKLGRVGLAALAG